MSRRRRDHSTARRLARRAYHRQGGLGFWCKQPMLLADGAGATSETDPRLMTCEHVRPMWDGGRSVAGNVVTACYKCNHGRSGELNQTKRGSKFTIGDDTPSSPFVGLRYY